MTPSASGAIVAIVVTTPYYATLSFLIYNRRHIHPITGRSPAYVLLINACLYLASLMTCVNHLVYDKVGTVPCSLRGLTLSLGIVLVVELLVVRASVLLFRLGLSRELALLDRSPMLVSTQHRHSRSIVREKRLSLNTGTVNIMTPSANIARDSDDLSSVSEEALAALDTGMTFSFIRHKHWISVKTQVIVTTLVMTLTLMVNVSLDAVTVSSEGLVVECSSFDTANFAGRAFVFVFLVLDVVVLLRFHSIDDHHYGMRKETTLTGAAILALCLLSALLREFRNADTGDLVVLIMYAIVAACINVYPLYLSVAAEKQALGLDKLKEIETFQDLIQNAMGYQSFLSFLKTEFSEENLLFWQEARTFSAMCAEIDEIDNKIKMEQNAAKRESDDDQAQQSPRSQSKSRTLPTSAPVRIPISQIQKLVKPVPSSITATTTHSAQQQHQPRVASPHSLQLAPTSPRNLALSLSTCTHTATPPRCSPSSKGSRLVLPSNDSYELVTHLANTATNSSTGNVDGGGSRSGNGSPVLAERPSPTTSIDTIDLVGSTGNSKEITPRASLSPHSNKPTVTTTITDTSNDSDHSGSRGEQLPQQPQFTIRLPTEPNAAERIKHTPTVTVTTTTPSPSSPQSELVNSIHGYNDLSAEASPLRKLRRVSWSIALEKKAERRAIERQWNRRSLSASGSNTFNHAHSNTNAGTKAQYGSPTHLPRLLIPTSVTANAARASPLHSPAVSTTTNAAGTGSANRLTVMSNSPTNSHRSVVSKGNPFMQTIVRALQATAKNRLLADGRRQSIFTATDPAAANDSAIPVQSLTELRQEKLQLLLTKACHLFDTYIAEGSSQQVNLPDAIVTPMIEKMRELHNDRYRVKLTAASASATPNNLMSPSQPYRTELKLAFGLVRNVTLNFFHHGSKNRVLPLSALPTIASGVTSPVSKTRGIDTDATSREVLLTHTNIAESPSDAGSSIATISLTKPLSSVIVSDGNNDVVPIIATTTNTTTVDPSLPLLDPSKLSFPLATLLTAASEAIEQLMEKDSFKRYLSSKVFQTFCAEYVEQAQQKFTFGLTTRLRQQSKSWLVAGSPKHSQRRWGKSSRDLDNDSGDGEDSNDEEEVPQAVANARDGHSLNTNTADGSRRSSSIIVTYTDNSSTQQRVNRSLSVQPPRCPSNGGVNAREAVPKSPNNQLTLVTASSMPVLPSSLSSTQPLPIVAVPMQAPLKSALKASKSSHVNHPSQSLTRSTLDELRSMALPPVPQQPLHVMQSAVLNGVRRTTATSRPNTGTKRLRSHRSVESASRSIEHELPNGPRHLRAGSMSMSTLQRQTITSHSPLSSSK